MIVLMLLTFFGIGVMIGLVITGIHLGFIGTFICVMAAICLTIYVGSKI